MKLRKYEIENQVKYLTLEQIEKGVKNPAVTQYAYILHDKDVDSNGNKKEPHYHVFIWLKDSYDSKYVAQWFGVQEQYIVRIKDDAGAMEYLTHSNETEQDKYQYDKSEIVANFDVEQGIKKAKEKKDKDARLKAVLAGIDSGEIRGYNFQEYLTCEEYVRWKRQVEAAFQYRTQKVKGANRAMKCIFITGQSGTGKTTYAKQIAEQKKYSVYVSSGSNDVLDDYQGQDCIILDDLRPSCMGLSDLLKMLDTNTASTVKSRYKNKVLECKLIIITTTLDIDTFFQNVFTEQPESAIQLQRRCETLVRMTEKTITVFIWQKVSRKYMEMPPMPNVVLEKFDVKDMTFEDGLSMMQSMLGVGQTMIDELRKNGKEYGLTDDLRQMKIGDIKDISNEDNGDLPF